MNGSSNGKVISFPNKNESNVTLEKWYFPLLVKEVPNTELKKFQKLIEDKYNQYFDSYWSFHKWSVKNFPDFWKEVWHYFKIISSTPYDQVFVKTGDGFLDNEWFRGAAFNLAENIMRIRDSRIGLICCDEFGNRETITYAEIYEQTKLYTAAFRKHGLKVGDRVAYYISNIKESLFAMLATISIGAIWGGPLPYHGPKIASSIMKEVDPKFIISVDHFQACGEQHYPIENLSLIAKDLPNLEKVIIVATRKETFSLDVSDIPNCILLDDFLQSGMTADGVVPDLIFEQLPFNHPTIINFTSGTTGTPKGVVHAAGTIIAQLRDFSLHLNLKEGDVVYSNSPVGWAAFDYLIPNLALGVTLLFFNGSPEYVGEFTFWDVLAQNKVSFAFLPSAYVNSFQTDCILPKPDTNLESLKILGLAGSPVRPQDYKFLLSNIKSDLLILSLYGATEVVGAFSGSDLNSPFHACECQVPSLGVDLHIFDEKGNSVLGKRGEVVVTKPNPSLPIYLWKDQDNTKLNDEYFSKYKGVWCQHDEGWINPETRGLVIIGRSDDTIKNYGDRLSSSDIYFAIGEIEELEDFICVGQDGWDGTQRAVLFVKLKKGYRFTKQLKSKIEKSIERELGDNVPEVILEIPDIPYNFNRKRMESVVRKIVSSNEISEVKNIRNPDCLKYYCDIPQLLKYNSCGVSCC